MPQSRRCRSVGVGERRIGSSFTVSEEISCLNVVWVTKEMPCKEFLVGEGVWEAEILGLGIGNQDTGISLEAFTRNK